LKESDKFKKWPGCSIFTGGSGDEERMDAALDSAAGLIAEFGGDENAVRRVRERIHPDVSILVSDSATIKIDNVRDMKSDVYAMPREGGAKVYIIPNAEKMTAQAQSSLLLVIEEPPPYVYFILTTSSTQLLLDTIRSRCTLFRLGSSAEEKTEIDENILALAGKFMELLCSKSEYGTMKFIWENQKLTKSETASMLTVILTASRDAAVIKSGAPEISSGSAKSEKIASSMEIYEICALMNILIEKLKVLERNVSPAHVLSAIPAEFFSII